MCVSIITIEKVMKMDESCFLHIYKTVAVKNLYFPTAENPKVTLDNTLLDGVRCIYPPYQCLSSAHVLPSCV